MELDLGEKPDAAVTDDEIVDFEQIDLQFEQKANNSSGESIHDNGPDEADEISEERIQMT